MVTAFYNNSVFKLSKPLFHENLKTFSKSNNTFYFCLFITLKNNKKCILKQNIKFSKNIIRYFNPLFPPM